MINVQLKRIIQTLALCAVSFPAMAASSEWAEVEGGSVRIVTEGLPDSDGRLRGALDIRLNSGWKTYWRDPGGSGIPPTVSVLETSDDAGVEIHFPAPQRFDDGYSVWAGYDRPVTLALTFDLPDSTRTGDLAVSVFLGICETICIPVQADFRIDLGNDREASADLVVVEHAFAAVPRLAGPDFGARLREASEERLLIDVEGPTAAPASQLFIAATENWAFDVPKLIETANGVAFEVPVLMAPDPPSAPDTIHYTLVAGEDAVSGIFEIAR